MLQRRKARRRCRDSSAYFINEFCWIDDPTTGSWVPFKLWGGQRDAIRLIDENQQTIILKARQLGLTWLILCYILWRMLFRAECTALLFSRRENESIHLLDERLRGIHKRLPHWMRERTASGKDSKKIWKLGNGSGAMAFPTNAGDSYTASIVLVDEADLIPDLNKLMRAVKPTIDAGGKIILLSRADKSRPMSEFKRTYKAAKQGKNDWAHLFLAWHVRPERDQAWYEKQKRDILSRTEALDDLHEQYPATDAEALSGKTLNKRIAPKWMAKCYVELEPLAALPDSAPSINGLVVYELPSGGSSYVVGADPAEGNPTSDDSALTLLEADTGEEVAKLSGKFQPQVLAAHAKTLAEWFNDAGIMVERNNHGHAVILWLMDNGARKLVLKGFDGKPGWNSNSRGKTLMYDETANAFRTGDTTLHSFDTHDQLSSIEGSTLRAPEGQFDDLADSYALGLVARSSKPVRPKGTELLKGRAIPARSKLAKR